MSDSIRRLFRHASPERLTVISREVNALKIQKLPTLLESVLTFLPSDAVEREILLKASRKLSRANEMNSEEDFREAIADIILVAKGTLPADHPAREIADRLAKELPLPPQRDPAQAQLQMRLDKA